MKSEVKNSKRDRASAPIRRNVSIVGAGRVGTALGMALSKNGYQVRAVITKDLAGARRAAKIFGQKAFALSADPLNSISYKQTEGLIRSSLILIATPDDVINSVARKMAAFFEQNSLFTRSKMRRTVLHTSGALSSAELQPLKRLGFATGSLHPLISISDVHSGSSMFRDSFFCVEGDKRARSAAVSIARALGGKTFSIKSNSKALYHAAAVMAAGNMIALFDMAIKMLQRCGLSPRQEFHRKSRNSGSGRRSHRSVCAGRCRDCQEAPCRNQGTRFGLRACCLCCPWPALPFSGRPGSKAPSQFRNALQTSIRPGKPLGEHSAIEFLAHCSVCHPNLEVSRASKSRCQLAT